MKAKQVKSAGQLRTFIQAVLKQLQFSDADAQAVSNALVRAHLRGYDTHGLPCLEGYIDAIEDHRITPKPEVVSRQRVPWAWTVDADNGLGQIGAARGMQLALETADHTGFGAATVKRSNHFGAASVYALMAAERDCIGIVTSNASSVTAPHGAAESLLGTNPISVAVPAGALPPFVIDMATSAGSRKKVRLALSEGVSIPPGWAVDCAGEPTTDAAKALEGVMLPFGGAKGSGISMLVDILSGVLSGSEFGGRVLSVFSNQERESNNGHFMLAMKIDAFMPVSEFKARMDEELNRVLNLKPSNPSKPVVYPGYRSGMEEKNRIEKGIPLDPKLVDRLKSMGAKYKVEFPV